jgi:hypothetical protein
MSIFNPGFRREERSQTYRPIGSIFSHVEEREHSIISSSFREEESSHPGV